MKFTHMKILLYYPTNGTNKTYEVSMKDAQKFYGLKIHDQFDGKIISSELEKSIVEITGGNDSTGVCMVPNQNHSRTVRLLLKKGDIGYKPKKSYIKKRKTVRGSVISQETSVISVILVRPYSDENGEVVIPGLTDVVKDKSHLPKKASKLRKLFGIDESVEDKDQLKKKIYQIIRESDPNMKLPRLKITGATTEKIRQKKKEELLMRKKRSEKFQEYKNKFNKDLLKNYCS